MIAIIGTTSDDILYFKAKMGNPKEVALTGGFKIYQGSIFREDCIVAATGPSLVDAGIIMTLIIEKFDPYMVFNVGSVYSFSDELRQGDLFIADRYFYADIDFTDNKEGVYGQIPGRDPFFVADNLINDRAEKNAYLMTTRYVQRGFLLSGSSFYFMPNKVSTIVQNHFLVQEENMRAYDNTSAAIAMVCHLNNTALLTIKGVAMQMGKERERINYIRTGLEMMPTIGKIITRILVARTEDVNE